MSRPFGVIISVAPLHLAGLWCLETNTWPWENHSCRKDKAKECEDCERSVERTVVDEADPTKDTVQ
jgi:hypothetical protein